MVNVYRSAGILFLGQQAMFVLKQSWSKAKKLLQLETLVLIFRNIKKGHLREIICWLAPLNLLNGEVV